MSIARELADPAPQLHHDLVAMRGVWRDRLHAYDVHGWELADDPWGGVPGPFPYTNLVYVDVVFAPDASGAVVGQYRQTNVTVPEPNGRALHVRTFEAEVRDGVLRFARLGPDAPEHVGVSGGPGLVWFVSERLDAPGVQRYSEPDLIRIDGDRRWRTTVLWRDGVLVRPMLVEGVRVATDPTVLHPGDPRPAGSSVHVERSVTTHYQANGSQANSSQANSSQEVSR